MSPSRPGQPVVAVTPQTEALLAVQRFARHAEERRLTLPLWAAILWDDAIGKVNDALAEMPSDASGGSDTDA